MRAGLSKFAWFMCASFVLAPTDATAALYWNAGVRAKSIGVCFVGDALTSRPLRVNQVLNYLKEFQYAANISFNFLGSCPGTTKQPNGDDYYDGDIRVVLPNTSVAQTGPVPGKVCPMFIENGVYNNKNGPSWSNAPDDLTKNRTCLYNLNLGDDPWNATPYLNHTLHEFGHALGLSHEHQRNDANVSACVEKYPVFKDQNTCEKAGHVWIGYCMNGYGVGASNGYMTPYDKNSVMHYRFSTCGINGNYDYTGLSEWDRLAVHILYLEDVPVAEFVGTTVIRTTDKLILQSAWKARGANIGFAAKNFQWKISGNTVSTSPDMNTKLPEGSHVFEFTHSDFLGRTYSYKGAIRVLKPAIYNRLIAATVAAQLTIL